MVQRQPSLTRLEPAERGHVDAGAAGHVLQRQTALHTQLAQPPSNPQVDIVLGDRLCLHGKLDWQIANPAASWQHERHTGALGRALRGTRTSLEWPGQRPPRRGGRRTAGRDGRSISAAVRAPTRCGWPSGAGTSSRSTFPRPRSVGPRRQRVRVASPTASSSSSTTCPTAFPTARSTLCRRSSCIPPFGWTGRDPRQRRGRGAPGWAAADRRPRLGPAVGIEAGPCPRIPQRRRGGRRHGSERRGIRAPPCRGGREGCHPS